MLLLSTGSRLWKRCEHFAGDVALDAADRFGLGFAFADTSLEVGTGACVGGEPDDGDPPQGRVELAVAAAVEPVTGGLAAAGGYRVRAGQGGEGPFVAQPVGVVTGADQDGRRGVGFHA